MIAKKKFLIIPILAIIALVVVIALVCNAPVEYSIPYKTEIADNYYLNGDSSYLNLLQWKMYLVSKKASTVLVFKGPNINSYTTKVDKNRSEDLPPPSQIYQSPYVKIEVEENGENEWWYSFKNPGNENILYRIIKSLNDYKLQIYNANTLINEHPLQNIGENEYPRAYFTKGDTDKILINLGDVKYIASGSGEVITVDEKKFANQYIGMIESVEIMMINDMMYILDRVYYNNHVSNQDGRYFMLRAYKDGIIVERVEFEIDTVIPDEGFSNFEIIGEVKS